jgi:hypothetical protein
VGIAWVGLWVISSTVAGVLSGIQHATLFHSFRQEEMAQGNLPPPPNRPAVDPDEAARKPNDKNRTAQMKAWQRVRERVERAQAEAAPTDWRPLCSYTANLQRLGEALLNSDAAWVEIGRAIEAPRAMFGAFFGGPRRGGLAAGQSLGNERRLADQLVPQYPWIWSAGVLAGLLGLSLWTMCMRVKSLDRLR